MPRADGGAFFVIQKKKSYDLLERRLRQIQNFGRLRSPQGGSRNGELCHLPPEIGIFEGSAQHFFQKHTSKLPTPKSPNWRPLSFVEISEILENMLWSDLP